MTFAHFEVNFCTILSFIKVISLLINNVIISMALLHKITRSCIKCNKFTHRWIFNVFIDKHGTWMTTVNNRCGIQISKIFLVDVYGIILQNRGFNFLNEMWHDEIYFQIKRIKWNLNFLPYLAHSWHLSDVSFVLFQFTTITQRLFGI